ncbi:MAG TPA: FHA domain-containing protein, partial [Kofleriaceae bacterium]|nr:FHA domain-containing protein [Kofleriaceae bacterium]
MGRVANPGAPQRVSAHVVQKAPASAASAAPPADDEDEKTTIEQGGWEEEASTTVEQGEMADKLRALGAARPNTAITSTNGTGMVEELTVDDQRAAAALARMPPPVVAHLVITQGNDAGQALEIRPGKTYTIGRAIDNDLVLTDIAVSRKHFDIRADNGAWVLADRGSGNGTLINNRIEDAPFMLASGDVIEIGNTTFRFELPQSRGAGRREAEELSTVSSKPPVREPELLTPGQLITPVAPSPVVAQPAVLAAAPGMAAHVPPPAPTAPLVR